MIITSNGLGMVDVTRDPDDLDTNDVTRSVRESPSGVSGDPEFQYTMRARTGNVQEPKPVVSVQSYPPLL